MIVYISGTERRYRGFNMTTSRIQTSFQLDTGTAEAIEELKVVFGVSSNTGVIRKAIALARIAARNSDTGDNTVTMIDKSGDRLKISLAR